MKSTPPAGGAGAPVDDSSLMDVLFYTGHILAPAARMADNDRRHEPTDAQLDAAVEGARNMVESKRNALVTDQDPVRQRGGGGVQGAGGTAQGGSNSAAGTDHSTDPAAETGGPRGAGTSISRTS